MRFAVLATTCKRVSTHFMGGCGNLELLGERCDVSELLGRRCEGVPLLTSYWARDVELFSYYRVTGWWMRSSPVITELLGGRCDIRSYRAGDVKFPSYFGVTRREKWPCEVTGREMRIPIDFGVTRRGK